MENRLIEKLSEITKEEKRILGGESIYREIYSKDENFVIEAKNIGKNDVSISRHIRFSPFPMHSHDYIEMMIVLGGSITHKINGSEIKLERGDILFMNKHISHSISLAEKEDIGVNVILSDGFIGSVLPMIENTAFSLFVRENSKPSGAPMYLWFSASSKRQIENLVENILFELLDDRRDANILNGTLALLLRYLSNESDSLLKGANIAESTEEKRKKAIASYVKNNYKTATLTELAKMLYLSESYLSGLIFDIFGKSFKSLLIDERMERALTLMLESSLPIGEIIRSVGYENSSYFHREFKKRFGATPLAIRKRSGA